MHACETGHLGWSTCDESNGHNSSQSLDGYKDQVIIQEILHMCMYCIWLPYMDSCMLQTY